MKKARYAMVVDTRRCVACKACVLACKGENAVPDGFCRDWLVEEVRGTFPTLTAENRSERCNHCSKAPCVSACPTGASHYAEGGVVLVDARKCTGCKACISSCAYGSRYLHPQGHVDKCTFCLHRVRKGLQPACVEVCPTRTLVLGDLEDPASEATRLLKSRRHKVLQEDTGNRPHVYFLT